MAHGLLRLYTGGMPSFVWPAFVITLSFAALVLGFRTAQPRWALPVMFGLLLAVALADIAYAVFAGQTGSASGMRLLLALTTPPIEVEP